LHRQKEHDKARIILEFINKRWPRYYIDDPDFLLMQAGNEEALQKVGPAMDAYWLYVNLEPRRAGNDALMLKMGDMYTRLGNKKAADFVYSELTRRFPDSQAAMTARLRLAENGIYESPLNYDVMRTVFSRKSEPPLWQTYCDLADSSRTVPEAVLARLKKAMWLYWDKQYTEAMGMAADFIDAYPDHTDVLAARDIIWQAFEKEMGNALAEENYGRILILWNGFPMVRERYGEIDPDMRYALARGWLERGNDQKAFELLGAFLQGPEDPKYGEAAFTEFFNRYLQAGAWHQILELAKMVEKWELRDEVRKQLDYAMALSAQNLNLIGPALTLWTKLAARTDIPLYQRAYATYFLARDAEKRMDIRNAYLLNKQVIELFGQLQDERSDKADPQRIKEATATLMDICEVGNRIPEALDWLKRYNAYVPDDSPEYPGLRFREARLYRKLGDSTRAQALLEEIVRHYAASPYAQAASGELRTFDVSRDLQSFMPGGDARQNLAAQQGAPGRGPGRVSSQMAPGGQSVAGGG
ncbi:MAG: tetratricopeptide repeat protein, partial [Desulfovibrionaceae bacterium]|nr:tetratricopeptide repeat protein [Desulfovibrionaceae bacterium]